MVPAWNLVLWLIFLRYYSLVAHPHRPCDASMPFDGATHLLLNYGVSLLPCRIGTCVLFTAYIQLWDPFAIGSWWGQKFDEVGSM